MSVFIGNYLPSFFMFVLVQQLWGCLKLTCSGHCTFQWWPAPTGPWSLGKETQTPYSPYPGSLDFLDHTAGSGSIRKKNNKDSNSCIEWLLYCCILVCSAYLTNDSEHIRPESLCVDESSACCSYQLVKCDPWTILSSNKPPGSSTNSGSTHIT